MYNACREEFMNIIEKSKLSDREILVLALRFGLYDGYCHTLEAVGKRFHVTRERVRQIEATAIRKLRRNPAIKEYEANDFSLYVYDPYCTRAKKR